MDEFFEELPPDVRRSILDETNTYTLNKEYYNSMLYYRELRCMRQVSNYEIAKSLNENNDLKVLLMIYYYDNYINDGNDGNDILSSICDYEAQLMLIDTTKNKTNTKYVRFRFNGDGTESSISTGPIRPGRYIEIDKDKIILKNYRGINTLLKDVYDYNDIFLLPSTLTYILIKRGELCYKHINKVMRDYITNTYDKLQSNPLLNFSWLLYCIDDLKINLDDSDDLSHKLVRHREREEYMIVNYLTPIGALDIIDILYQLVLNNI